MTDTTTNPQVKPVAPKPPYVKRDIHPLIKDLFPPLPKDEYARLKSDIYDNGVRVPIVLYQGQILDGCNRNRVCSEFNWDPPTTDLPAGADPFAYVVSANLHRRHLDESQRGIVAAKLATRRRGENQHTAGEGLSIERASGMLNVSEATANRCRKVLTDGVPKLAELVTQGKLAASVAEKVAKLDKAKQAMLVDKKVSEIKEAVREPPTSTAISDKLDKLKTAYLETMKKLGKSEQQAAVAELLKELAAMGLHSEKQ
jgi:hypothetical protein